MITITRLYYVFRFLFEFIFSNCLRYKNYHRINNFQSQVEDLSNGRRLKITWYTPNLKIIHYTDISSVGTHSYCWNILPRCKHEIKIQNKVTRNHHSTFFVIVNFNFQCLKSLSYCWSKNVRCFLLFKIGNFYPPSLY